MYHPNIVGGAAIDVKGEAEDLADIFMYAQMIRDERCYWI